MRNRKINNGKQDSLRSGINISSGLCTVGWLLAGLVLCVVALYGMACGSTAWALPVGLAGFQVLRLVFKLLRLAVSAVLTVIAIVLWIAVLTALVLQ